MRVTPPSTSPLGRLLGTYFGATLRFAYDVEPDNDDKMRIYLLVERDGKPIILQGADPMSQNFPLLLRLPYV